MNFPDEEDDDAPFEGETVVIPIEESIDLHLFRPSEVGDVVDGYLEAAAERGFREVRIIHGRGRGVQRNRVRRHLERSPLVEFFSDAPGDRGGFGATIAWLHPTESGEGSD
jgi:dsDNA-specific endonuclease/ATPase MutS2